MHLAHYENLNANLVKIQTRRALAFPSPNRRSVILAERPSIDEALTTNTLISDLIVDVNTVVPANVAFSKLRTDEPGVLFN